MTTICKDLGISSSALSQSVRQLEKRLGVALLSRTTRSVALTNAGRRLFEQAGPAVNQSLEALKAASARTGGVAGRIRLTVPTIAMPLVITPWCLSSSRSPEVEVQVDNRRSNIVTEGFDAGIRLEESVPGFFLYFPSRTQVSPAFRAFVDTARQVMSGLGRLKAEPASRRAAEPT